MRSAEVVDASATPGWLTATPGVDDPTARWLAVASATVRRGATLGLEPLSAVATVAPPSSPKATVAAATLVLNFMFSCFSM
jgi:hypothetical protein